MTRSRGLVGSGLVLLLTAFPVVEVVAKCPSVQRSQAVLRQFRKLHPCPATGKTTGPCKGWVIDHVVPLCLRPEKAQLDVVSNLAWQEYKESLIKDKYERQMCRSRGCHHGGD